MVLKIEKEVELMQSKTLQITFVFLLLLALMLTGCSTSVPEVTEPAQPATPVSEAPTEAPTEAATEPPTEAPTEPVIPDCGVYPDPRAFIDGTGNSHHVWTTDTYQYDTINGVDQITGPMPYYWEQISFDPLLEDYVWEYLKILEEEPFNLELIYSTDMGDEWVYVYRYNGEQPVYPLSISGFIPEDAGVYHLAVDICKTSRYRGTVGFEIAVGYGLEGITPDICHDILDGKGYERTSTHEENLKPENPKQDFFCYYCKKTVIPKEDTYMGDEQIIYCDDCYADMFATEPTE